MAFPNPWPVVIMKEGFFLDLAMFAVLAAGSAFLVLLATA